MLEVNATTSTLSLNGGTLRAGTNQSNFIAVDQALVGAGGALIRADAHFMPGFAGL